MSSKKTIDLKIPGLALGIVIVIFVLWVILVLVLPYMTGLTLDKLGQFGDSFAVVNTLFSALALVGVAIAIAYQRHELKRQEEEFKEQGKQQRLQQFDATFFNMVNLLNEIIKGLHVRDISGRDVFIKLENSLKETHHEKRGEKNEPLEYYNIDRIQKVYDFYFYNCEAGNQLSHYFRSLYTILKFVECSALDYKIKKQYTSILRSQLSNSELFILFYNCLWQDKFATFRLLVEKYAFLEHIQKKEVGAHQLAYYQSNAYGENCPDDMTPGKFNRSKYSDIYPEDKNFIVDEPLTY